MRVSHELGKFGEELAANHLRLAGLEIVDRNWRCPHGELDIVGRDGPTVVLVEVKTRRSTAFGDPAEAVTAAKLARLRRLAHSWLASQDQVFEQVRIDVVAVLVPRGGQPQIRHVVGVQ